MSARSRALRLASLLAVSLWVAPFVSRAQAGDPAAAEHLFQEALDLMAKGQYAEACPRLAESQKLDPGVGTLLYLGDCHARLGKTATAWATFREAESAAQRAGQAKRESMAREKAQALESQLGRLAIEVPDASKVEGLVVRRDGQGVAAVLWNTPVPIDPGTYTIAASAPGKTTFTVSVVIPPGSGTKLVTIEPLQDAPAVAPSSTPPGAPSVMPPRASAPPPAPPPEPRAASPGMHPLRIAGIAVGGAGLLTMGASLGVGFVARARFDAAAPHCGDRYCDREGVAIRKDAVGIAGTGTAIFVAGAAATVLGTVLIVVAPASRGAAQGRTSVGLALGPGAVTVGGSFP